MSGITFQEYDPKGCVKVVHLFFSVFSAWWHLSRQTPRNHRFVEVTSPIAKTCHEAAIVSIHTMKNAVDVPITPR